MNRRYVAIIVILVVALMLLNCAPGNERWDQDINYGDKAGFWVGIWHGLIIVITFIVSLFTKEVGIYEINNTGWPYNLGFLIGLLFSVGGGIRIGTRRRRIRRYEWGEIGDKVEERVCKGIKAWLEETKKEGKEKEWEEIARKIEEKIKKALKEWVDKK
ncbi:hypothetical protein ES703_06780 [subsurface metagenome]